MVSAYLFSNDLQININVIFFSVTSVSCGEEAVEVSVYLFTPDERECFEALLLSQQNSGEGEGRFEGAQLASNIVDVELPAATNVELNIPTEKRGENPWCHNDIRRKNHFFCCFFLT